MKNKNCPNCAAVLEQNTTKCPYCGTSYLDICGLKLDGTTPIILTFTHPQFDKTFTCKVIPTLDCTITSEVDDIVCYRETNKIVSYRYGINRDLELHFKMQEIIQT
jgi:hypothetical protein